MPITAKQEAPKSLEESEPQLLDKLRIILLEEIAELSKCNQIDIKFLWANGNKTRYRVNGWKIKPGIFGIGVIICSYFIRVWDGEKGIQYEIL